MIYHSALIRSERRCFYCKESSKTTFFFDASVHESINETSYFQYLPPSFSVLVTINMKYFWLETDVNPNKLRLQHLIPVYLCWVCWKSSRWVSSRGQKPCITSSQLGHRPPSWKRRMCTQSKKKDCGVPSIKCRPTFSNRSPQCPRSLIGWNIKRKSILRAKACSCQSHTHTSTLQTENQEKEDAERAKRVEMFGWAVFRMIWNNLSPAGVRSGSR